MHKWWIMQKSWKMYMNIYIYTHDFIYIYIYIYTCQQKWNKMNQRNKFKSLALQTPPSQWDRARSATPVEHGRWKLWVRHLSWIFMSFWEKPLWAGDWYTIWIISIHQYSSVFISYLLLKDVKGLTPLTPLWISQWEKDIYELNSLLLLRRSQES